jgi:hypothetical protein
MEFVNAQEMMKKHPETFYAPSKEELDNIKIGDSVKVCVEDKERFWVTVTEIDGENITGEVDNVLIDVDLELGEIIKFKKENVYNIF